MTITVFWEVMPYSLLYVNQRFGKARFLQLQIQQVFYAKNECSTFVQNFSSYMPNPDGVTSQKTIIFVMKRRPCATFRSNSK